jgi:hypothetical protein
VPYAYLRRHQINWSLIASDALALPRPMPIYLRGGPQTRTVFDYSCVAASSLPVTMGLGCGCFALGLVGTCWAVGELWVQSRTTVHPSALLADPFIWSLYLEPLFGAYIQYIYEDLLTCSL